MCFTNIQYLKKTQNYCMHIGISKISLQLFPDRLYSWLGLGIQCVFWWVAGGGTQFNPQRISNIIRELHIKTIMRVPTTMVKFSPEI